MKAPGPHSEWCKGTCGKGGCSSNSMEYCQAQQELILAAQPECICRRNETCPRHGDPWVVGEHVRMECSNCIYVWVGLPKPKLLICPNCHVPMTETEKKI